MALTTVVTDRFFEKLLPVLKELDREEGPLTLAMLVPSSVDSNYRSLVLSSEHLDALGPLRATSKVLAKLRERLGKDASKIDTVSILRTQDSVVRWLGESYDIPELGTAYQALKMPILERDVDDPILFLSKLSVAAAA